MNRILTFLLLMSVLVACSKKEDDEVLDSAVTGIKNGHGWVDLGLTSGTLWATCNVGAETPDKSGDYYAWGETETHYLSGASSENPTWKSYMASGYNWKNYRWSKDTYYSLNKYCTDEAYGMLYNKTELEQKDDAAVVSWGGGWMMPTQKQMEELYNECYWVWTRNYKGENANGYIVYKAKQESDKGVKVFSEEPADESYDASSDLHIFLPTAGYRCNTDLKLVGGTGYYWSNSVCVDRCFDAYVLKVSTYGTEVSGSNRFYGHSVRPVCTEK